MLYIKGLANCNSVDFEEQLKKSAIQVNDREKLHDLIHNSTPVNDSKLVEQKQESKETESITPKDKKVETKNDSKEKTTTISTQIPQEIQTPKVEKKSVVKKNEIALQENKTKSTDDKVDMAKIIEDIRLKAEAARLKKEIPPKKNIDSIPDLKQDKIEEKSPVQESVTEEETKTPITEKIAEKSDDLVIETKQEITKQPQTEEKPLEIDILSQAMETAFELDVDNIIRDTVSEEKKSTPISLPDSKLESENIEETNIENPNELSFTEWLKYKQGKLKLNHKNEGEKEKIKLTKSEIDTLLNKFIEEEPKMSRPQKEFFNPAKNAKKSLDESNVLVSETLAKIYWMQKNYDKAIKAYEQLSLRNPEKKSFFANQIKKIKQELNKFIK